MMKATAAEIRARIEECVSHLTFLYNGKDGVIDPYYVPGKGHFYPMCYDGKETVVRTVDEVMDLPFFDGRTLTEIAEKLEIDEW